MIDIKLPPLLYRELVKRVASKIRKEGRDCRFIAGSVSVYEFVREIGKWNHDFYIGKKSKS